MADSGGLRVRRHRRHARGDHSLCLPSRCDEAADALDDRPLAEVPVAGEIEVARFLGGLVLDDLPAEVLAEVGPVEQLRRRREGRRV